MSAERWGCLALGAKDSLVRPRFGFLVTKWSALSTGPMFI